MADGCCSHQRQEDKVVLLALVLIDSRDRLWSHSFQRCSWSASLGEDIGDQLFLSIVCCDHGDLVWRMPNQDHILEESNDILSFADILIEICRRCTFSPTLKLLHIDYLRSMNKAWVRKLKLDRLRNMVKISEVVVTPAVKRWRKKT